MKEEAITHHIGYMTGDKGLVSTNTIDSELSDRLHNWVAPFADLSSRLNYEIVTRNYRDLRGILQTMARVNRMVGYGERRVDNGKMLILSSWSSYLNSCRMYIDSTRSTWSRRYGAKSTAVSDFDSLLSNLYDTIFGYRFCYKLRNLLQHVEMDGLSVTFTTEARSPVQSVTISRDVLLGSYDSWGTVKNDIEEAGDVIDLTPLFAEAQVAHRKIERFVLIRTIEEMGSKLPELLTIARSASAPLGSTAMHFTLPDNITTSDAGDFKISMTPLPPIDSLEKIATAIEQGTVDTLVTLEPEERDDASSDAVSAVDGPMAGWAFEVLLAALADDQSQLRSSFSLAVQNQDVAVKAVSALINVSNVLLHEVALLTGPSTELALSRHLKPPNE